MENIYVGVRCCSNRFDFPGAQLHLGTIGIGARPYTIAGMDGTKECVSNEAQKWRHFALINKEVYGEWTS